MSFIMLIVLLISLFYPAALTDDDDWWYDQGHDWDTSDHFNSYNPFYQTFKQIKGQLDMYGYAKHVGKINRGQFLNPELIQPGHRAFGYKSDFDLKDVNSGAFRYQPKGQKYRAKPVHVSAGLASKIGEIATMPVGQYVQNDGSVLIQTSKKQSNPCSPSPCMDINFPMCEVVLDNTAKCSRSETFTMTLTFEDPVYGYIPNILELTIASVTHEGTACDDVDVSDGGYLDNGHSACGVNMDQPYTQALHDNGVDTIGKDVSIFETLEDGTNWEDYTHQILVEYFFYNLGLGYPTLTITDDNGEEVQVLEVPQDDSVVQVNPDDKWYYFFGCFRSLEGFVDTRGAGFYCVDPTEPDHVHEHVLDTGLPIFDAGLCNALYQSSIQPGFNPYH